MGLPDVELKIDALTVKVDALTTKIDLLLPEEKIYVKCQSCTDGLVPRSVDHSPGGVGPEVEMITCPYCNGTKIVEFGKVV